MYCSEIFFLYIFLKKDSQNLWRKKNVLESGGNTHIYKWVESWISLRRLKKNVVLKSCKLIDPGPNEGWKHYVWEPLKTRFFFIVFNDVKRLVYFFLLFCSVLMRHGRTFVQFPNIRLYVAVFVILSFILNFRIKRGVTFLSVMMTITNSDGLLSQLSLSPCTCMHACALEGGTNLPTPDKLHCWLPSAPTYLYVRREIVGQAVMTQSEIMLRARGREG